MKSASASPDIQHRW